MRPASRPRRGSTTRRQALGLALLLLCSSLPVSAADEPVVQIGSGPELRVWLEARSTRAGVTWPLAGAQRTDIAFGRVSPEGPELLRKGSLVPNQALFSKARAAAEADLVSLRPRFVRDRQKVIQYAELTSPEPIVASAVLAPRFLELFRDTLGETVLVVVPSRFTAFVFPALASRYQEYYPLVFEAFRETAYPVSVEVFEFSANGIRAIGVYERP